MIFARFGMIALAGATAVSLAACGTSNTTSPAQSATPTSPGPSSAPAPANHQRVAGLIASVAGDTIQVNQRNGMAAVDFTPSTKVSEEATAGLPDVTPGSCVIVRPTRDNPQNAGAITAAAVRVSAAVDGKCAQPDQPPAGSTPIHGTVASVAGNIITVNGATGNTTQTVSVSDKTRYTKENPANSQAIAQGKCITAQGTEGNGALQATTIRLRPASNGKCPAPGARPHGHGG